MVVIGAGPIGCELAQAFQRLGTQVTLIERTNQILTREDPDAARIVSAAMARDGVEIINGGTVIRVDRTDGAKRVRIDLNVEERLVETDVILIGAGRVPNVEGLGLDAVGVAFNEREGVHIDDTLRTTNPRIFAAGDVCMKHKFTHMADAAARIVIQNALFGFAGKKKLSALTVPWCTYTDPEIAHVGLGEREAAERGLAIDTIRVSMSEVDRAIAEGETDGLLKVYLRKGSGTILGATLVARHAGELIGQITLAMVAGVGLGKISNVIYPYPTQAEIIKKAADTYNRARLTPLVRSVFERVLRWQR
jgi:pyruvate/2-oxoglutarate dehydrogenase complex dihydrolipoamide dehydrogenase (E3) component